MAFSSVAPLPAKSHSTPSMGSPTRACWLPRTPSSCWRTVVLRASHAVAVTESDPGVPDDAGRRAIRGAEWANHASVHHRQAPHRGAILTFGDGRGADEGRPGRIGEHHPHTFQHIVGPIAQVECERDFARSRPRL